MEGPKKEMDVLEDIEKRSEELLSSNEELASRLRKNQSTLETINTELESLRRGEEFNPALKARLESLKAELEEKKALITDLIDSVKPIEVDMNRSEHIVNALKQRIEDQGRKIEALSKDIFEHRKSTQQLTEANKVLKEKLVEKESTIQILKERLKDRTEILRTVDEKNRNMEQEVAAAKKKVFAMENNLGVVEKRIYESDERNQQLMYELMKSKDRIRQIETLVAQKDQLVDEKNAEFEQAFAQAQVDAEEKRRMIMEAHSKKVAVMNMQIASLKASLEQHKKLADARSRKESALMKEFGERMRSLMSTTANIANMPVTISEPEEPFSEGFSSQTTEEAPVMAIPPPAPRTPTSTDSRIEEIIPMVEMALEHGDTTEQIQESLSSSGYSSEDVLAALHQLQNSSNE